MESKLNYVFFGCTKYSLELLQFLVEKGFKPSAIFSIPKQFKISYSKDKVTNYNYADLKGYASENKIPHYEVDSTENKRTIDYYNIIKDIKPTLILVLGWYYMVPKKIRLLAKYGSWGIHASLLPKYAGGAPLNWAIINGEKETGVTLFRMEEGIDDGDIIKQIKFPIKYNDTIKEVYEKATKYSKRILLETLENIEQVSFMSQDKSKIEIWPQRKPEDGEIDLTKNAEEIYNFIRAQSSPYPGAYIKTRDGKKLIIEKARVQE